MKEPEPSRENDGNPSVLMNISHKYDIICKYLGHSETIKLSIKPIPDLSEHIVANYADCVLATVDCLIDHHLQDPRLASCSDSLQIEFRKKWPTLQENGWKEMAIHHLVSLKKILEGRF